MCRPTLQPLRKIVHVLLSVHVKEKKKKKRKENYFPIGYIGIVIIKRIMNHTIDYDLIPLITIPPLPSSISHIFHSSRTTDSISTISLRILFNFLEKKNFIAQRFSYRKKIVEIFLRREIRFEYIVPFFSSCERSLRKWIDRELSKALGEQCDETRNPLSRRCSSVIS